MAKMKGSWKISFVMGTIGKILMKGVNKAAKNCAKAEEKTLREILNYAKDSQWGKSHNFAYILEAKTADELYKRWQENVPPAEYEDFKPFIERHKNGEANILFPGKPKMYATTSGTTKEPKWIPITEEFYANNSKMSKIWLYTMLKYRPKVFENVATSIVGKAIEGAAPDGTICGSVSGISRKDIPAFIKKLYAEHDDVFAISDYKARYYTIMRIGIEHDIHLIVTANPSTIVEMQNNVNEYFNEYVTDIENGTLNKDLKIEPEIRKNIEAMFKPNPARAAELRALKEKYPNILPKHYWPNIQVLTTWRCGNTHVYVDKFKNAFPEEMFHYEFGYFATECCPGKVLDYSNGTVMFAHMNFFEFVPEEQLDLPKEQQTFLRLSQLEKGKRYAFYITTWAGLYRYNMNDLIEVTDFYGTLPKIELIQKINGIITMTGEKLHERQFIEAVNATQKETNTKLKFFIGFADLEKSAYHFYYEFADQNTSQEEAEKFTQLVDKKLKEINCEYKTKRDSFRVKDPITHLLQADSFEKFKARCIDEGARDGQFKLNLLLQDEVRHAKFKDLIKK